MNRDLLISLSQVLPWLVFIGAGAALVMLIKWIIKSSIREANQETEQKKKKLPPPSDGYKS